MADDGKVIFKIEGDDSGLDKDLDKSTETIKTKTSSWEKISSGALNAIGAAAASMATQAANAVFEYGNAFEQSLAAASTLIDTNVTNMDALREKMLELSDSSGIAADELNNALYSALSAGVPATEDMSEAVGFLESATKLAKAGFTDINTAVEATAKVLNAYGMDVSKTDEVHKILMQTQNLGIATVGELGSVLAQVTPTAAAMNVNFQNVGAALATMTAAGTPAAQATTQLNSLIAELSKEGQQAQQNLMLAAEGSQYAGMSFSEMMASGASLNDVLTLLESYAGESNLTLIDMFGSIEAGKAALSMTGESAQTFIDNLAAMATETDVVGEAYDKVTSTSGAQFDEMLNMLKNGAIEVFGALSPLVAEMLPHLMTAIEMLLPPIMSLVESLLPPLMSLFEAIWPIIEKLIPIVEKLALLLVDVLGAAFEALEPYINAVMDALDGLIEFISGVFSGNWQQAWDGLKQYFGSVFEAIKSLFKVPINWIIDGINVFIGGLNKLKIPDWVPGIGGKGLSISLIPRLQRGEDYVMDDWTPAYLDRGERVLTAAENQKYTALGGLSGIENVLRYGGGSSSGAQKVQVEVGLKVYPREMAHAITPYIESEQDANDQWRN